MSVVHKIGLYLCFGSGVLWLWCLVYLTLGLHPVHSSRLLLSCRVLACALNSATFVVMLICGEVARASFHGDDPTKWGPGDGGWSFHIVSTVSEWLMALSLDLAILSLVPEFRQLEFEDPRIIVNIERRGFIDSVDMEDDYTRYSHQNSSNSLVA